MFDIYTQLFIKLFYQIVLSNCFNKIERINVKV